MTAPRATQISFKNCAKFSKCITKIDGTTIDIVEELDLVRIILKQQDVYGFILKMKQIILIMILKTLLVLTFSSIRRNYWKTEMKL